MKNKCLAVGIILLFVGIAYAPAIAQNTEKQSVSRGTWLYVGGSGPGNYSRIQDAVNDSSNGDTVFVFSGYYHERVNVSKTIHLLGEDKVTTILYHEEGERLLLGKPILNISSDGVVVSNFTINITSGRGIYLIHSSNCRISNNIIQGRFAFWIRNSCQNNEVCYNIIQSDIYSGIGRLDFNLPTSDITGNVIHHNHFIRTGMKIDDIYAKNNTICDNFFDQIIGDAIYAVDTGSNTFARNIITGDPNIGYYSGIYFDTRQYMSTGGNLVCDNIFKNFSGGGIATFVYGGDVITGNLIEHCFYGMSINENFITIKNNTIRYCDFGQDLWSADSILEGNVYDHCIDGIQVRECQNVTFIRNTFSNNIFGITNHVTRNNYFVDNNFKRNKIDVFQQFSRNQWSHNYWDRPRALPKPIFGIFPFVQFDLRPALLPQ